MVPLATSPRRTDGRPAVPWSWKTTGFATALGGRAQPVVFHDQSVGIAARHKTPKRSAHPSRLDENAFFLLTKKTPYKVAASCLARAILARRKYEDVSIRLTEK